MIVKPYQICPGCQISYIYAEKIHFIGIIDDTFEYIISIFKVDGHSEYLLYLRKPAGDS